MKQKILIIGASHYQKYLYERAKALNLYIIGVDKNPNAPMFKHCDDYQSIDIFNVKDIYRYAIKMNVDFVCTINIDQGMNAVSEVQRMLGLPTLSKEEILYSTRKDLMREVWKQNNVKIPDYWVFGKDDISKAIKLIRQYNKKLIIKPVDNAAKRGISITTSNDKYPKEKIEYAINNSKSKLIIIEEFVEGELYFAPTYIFNEKRSIIGLIKQQYNENLVQIKYNAPAITNNEIKKEITNEAHKAALCFGNGAFHTEIIYSREKGALLVETSPRVSYATVALTRIIDNFDPVTAIINDASNMDLDYSYNKTNANFAVLEHIIPQKNSIFNGVDISKFEINNVYEISPVVEKGHIVNEFKTNVDRVMYFVAYANSESELDEKATSIKKQLIKECFKNN